MNDSFKFRTLVLSGFLTLIMTSVIPIEGGGAGMVFFITVPFFIVLGVILGIVYRFVSKKVFDTDVKQITFFLMLFFIVVFSLLAYPYDNMMLYDF